MLKSVRIQFCLNRFAKLGFERLLFISQMGSEGLSVRVAAMVMIVQELNQFQTFQLTSRGELTVNWLGLNQF